MYPLKQSGTTINLVFFMVDSSDHITGKTGLSPTVTLSKNGASFAAASGAVTEVGSGWYKVAANNGDDNTVGPLALHATATGADPCDVTYYVQAIDPYDFDLSIAALVGLKARYSTTGLTLQAGSSNTATLDASSSAVDDRFKGDLLCIISGTGARQARIIQSYVGSTKVATVAPAWDTAPDNTSAFVVIHNGGMSSLAGQGYTEARAPNLDNLNATVSSRASQTSLDTLDDFVDTEVAAIKAKTDNLPAAPAAVGDIPTAVQIRTEMDDNSADLNTIITNLNTVDDFLDTEIAAIKAKTDLIPTDPAETSDIPTAAQIRTEIDTNSTKLDVAVGTRASQASLDTVDGIVDDILADTADMQPKLGTPAVSVSADIAAVKGETASLIARVGAITGSGVNTVLGFFKALASKVATTPSDLGGTFDPAADSQEAIREAVDGVTVGGGTIEGKVDDILGRIGTPADTLADDIAAVKVDTGNIGFTLGSPANDSLAEDIASIQTDTNAIETNTQDIQGRLPATLSGGKMRSQLEGLDANTLTAASTAADFVTEMANAAGGGVDLTPVLDRLPATLSAGKMRSQVEGMDADTVTNSAIAADAIGSSELAASGISEIQSGLATAAAQTTAQTDLDDIQTRLPAALVGGRMDSHVGAMLANVITASVIATDAFGSLELAESAALEIATKVELALAGDFAALLATGITVVSPITSELNINLLAGYDYTDETTPLLWSYVGGIDLTDAEAFLVTNNADEDDIVTDAVLTIIDAGEATQIIKCELDQDQTATLRSSRKQEVHAYRLKIVLDGGAEMVLAEGVITVR